MKTLIIITLLLLVLTIVLIALIAKKFLDKTDHILASNALVSNNITDNAKKILNLLNTIDKEVKAEASNMTKLLSVISSANKNIIDTIDVSNKALVNSINAIEEKNNVIVKILEEIAKFNEHHRKVTEMLDNKIIAARLKREEISNTVHNISDSIRIIRRNIEGSSGTKPELQKFNNKLIEFCDELNVIKQTLSNFDEVDCSRHQTIYDTLKEIKNIAVEINNTTPNSEDIIDSDELVKRIAEGLYNKMMDLQAKNSLSTTKTKKPSLHKAKTTGKLRTAVKQDNSQQERINEIAKQQNK